MEILHCKFPDDLLYDLDGNTWARLLLDGTIQIGITSLLSNVTGKMNTVTLRPVGTLRSKGQNLGTLESIRSVAPIPSPISGKIILINNKAVDCPSLLNRSPYDKGWVAHVHPSKFEIERSSLFSTENARSMLEKKILEFRVHCFKMFPDHEMYEIGTECLAVLVRLNEQIGKIPVGEVVHVVSDDPTAYVEMSVWADKTGQNLAEWRLQDGVFHFIVEKVR